MSFLLFSSKLMQFSSSFFNLDANFFGIRLFLNFEERFLGPRGFSSMKLTLSAFWQEGFSFLESALHDLNLFSQKMLITLISVVTLPVFAVSIAISLALVVSLGAVSATLFRWGSVDE
jgi:hypothetical protein